MFQTRRKATTNCHLLFSRHFLFIDSHQQSQLKKEKLICNVHHQPVIRQQQPFGSNASILLGSKDKKHQQNHQSNLSGYNAAQIGGNNSNNKIFLLMVEEQKRFFATSSSFSSGRQQEQQKSPVQIHRCLAYNWLQLDAASTLHLKLQQGKSGWKFFTLKKISAYIVCLPNMELEVGYQLISTMDALLRTLLAKHLEIVANLSSDEMPGYLVLESQHFSGEFHDIRLELVRHLKKAKTTMKDNDDAAYIIDLFIRICTTNTEQHNMERKLHMPVRALPWLRHEMAQMLVEHDQQGSRQLGPAPPLELPEFILKDRYAVKPPRLSQIFHLSENKGEGRGSSKDEEQQEDLLPATTIVRKNLAKKWLRLDAGSRLQLKLRQGENRKFFGISKSIDGRSISDSIDFPTLALEVGYPLVSAMDTLLRTLAAKHQQQQDEINQSSDDEHQHKPGHSPLVLESQRVDGLIYDFQLEVVRLGNNGAYMLKLNTLRTVYVEHNEREMRLPVRALPWLRHAMAQMLVEHDQQGSQQLGPAPPELPESILKARPTPAAVPIRPQFRKQRQQQQFSGDDDGGV